ncbi:MAG: 1-deoxy-D-xylulose-5-phosphate synthase [Bacilli bacterium]|nr:1-deoxy-D-xylulose-5-phosphate synthase [Bacilli bacterium]
MGEYKHIYNIQSPEYLKDKSLAELEEIAKEIREFLIEKVSINGGHLSPNLGVVEATIALHYVFDFKTDKLIFDVGHQSYVHKILTGRAKDFDDLRKEKGVSGFPKYSESDYDAFETGHSSTSISAMCGYLEEKKNNPNIGDVVAFIGDGAFQNGLALAGLNYLASKQDQKGIVIVNDNEMSISKNVGWTAQFFNRLRIKGSFKLIRKLTTTSFRNAVKSYVYRNFYNFSLFGLTYIGPIDGHNLKELINYFEYAKKSSSSLVLHIKTIKGKGYEPAENDKVGKFHGVGPFDIESGMPVKNLKENEMSFSLACGHALDKVLENKNIKVLTPGMLYGMGLTDLSVKYQDQVIDIGIAEENAVVMASAMAKCGAIPIVATYSTFLQRAYDEINHDVTRSDSHVIFLVDHAGLVSRDGNTHQGIFDLSILSGLPNIIISEPKDAIELNSLLDLAIETPHPFVIRYPKDNVLYSEEKTDLEIGKWKVLKELKEQNIISYEPVLDIFSKEIEDNNLNIGLISALFIKPLDEELLRKLNNTSLYIYEDVVRYGSLSMIIEDFIIRNNLNIKVYSVNVETYPDTGTKEEMEKRLGLNPIDFIKNIK